MIYYLILCRSLTYAQRTARLLERAGINGHIMRVPKAVAKEGCGYCVRIPEPKLTETLKLLKREDMAPRQVYMQSDDGAFSEVFS